MCINLPPPAPGMLLEVVGAGVGEEVGAGVATGIGTHIKAPPSKKTHES